eukprot:11516735-Alexandrium_andersonii.AAC.1
MARAGAHKLEHFHMLECDHSAGSSMKVTPDMFSEYRGPSEFASLAARFADHRKLQKRIADLRSLLKPVGC